MKYKPITDITDQEIEQLWKDIFNVDKITFIKRKVKKNEIEVRFTTTWETGDEQESYEDIEDTVIMWSDNFYEPDFLVKLNDYFKYQQFMIAKGYSKYWKDNPYVD